VSRAVQESNRRLLRAQDAMDRTYAQPLDVPSLARIACVSEAHFIRTLRATFGATPHRYLQRRRVERSMFLLRESDRSVTDICFDVAVPGQPGRAILLEVPGRPAMDAATAERVRELVTKGAAGSWIGFATDDCQRTYETLLARGVEFAQAPVERSYGIDCGLRDPFGNAIRISQMTPPRRA
jgi:hypothetical protein